MAGAEDGRDAVFAGDDRGVGQRSTGVVDALLMQRIIRTAPIDEENILTAYLAGLPALAAQKPQERE